MESEKLVEAAESPELAEQDDSTEATPFTGYTNATVEFLNELPAHVNDTSWHQANRDRYCNVLRDPTRRLVEMLRSKYVERLSPEVAGARRPISVLKKNDYGQGGYNAHYWFAFYDPNAGSRTKSVQLIFVLLGIQKSWRYGLSMGAYADQYLQRLQSAWQNSSEAMASYIAAAPQGTIVDLYRGDSKERLTPASFADVLRTDSHSPQHFEGLSRVDVIQEFPLESLPDHSDTLVKQIGDFFTWAWPLFESSRTGEWPQPKPAVLPATPESEESEDVDEGAPGTLEELSKLTSLPLPFLEQLEQALLAKQQAVLVGPPGTSKTYIARQFARYFVAQHPGGPQGKQHVLYMHANWTYEDFFEGIKPTASKDGVLTFHAKKGLFLEWTEQLKSYDSTSRHVLVLDEINRCDTAAVLGELLQLLEYRGTTVPLLSGRPFVFPRNLFIIGTMNSADRSIGRMDLALRRRFLWLNLHPQPKALQRWLDRVGNNPVGFKASSLAECNELLAQRKIPVEQHIGHALFMMQKSSGDDTFLSQDVPLTENQLRQVVEFSVIPYVRELFTTHFGQTDNDIIIDQMRSILLKCTSTASVGQGAGGAS